jgi:ribosomal protein S27AE
LVGSLVGRLGGGIGLGGAAKKKYPDCAESVLADAQVCKHCGYRFDQVARRAPTTAIAKKAPSDPVADKRTVVCPLCDAEQRIPATAVRFTCGRCTEISPVPA